MISLFRFLRILHVVFVYGLDEAICKRFPPSRILCFIPRFRRRFQKPISQRIVESFITLGPVFVKLGQILSTRPDFCHSDLILALSELQDQVPPFSSEKAIQIIEEQLNSELNYHFQSFDIKPLASASVAQVHAGVLMDGTEVVIKVVRPNIEKSIKKDVRLMYTLCKIIGVFFKQRHQFRLIELVKEFESTLYLELDLMREAANTSQMRRNATDAYIPKIHWKMCTKQIITLERIKGISIDEIDKLKKENVNIDILSKKLIKIFFTDVFDKRFFHADMHPGNIFVDIKNPQDPKIMLVDFGIMGSLSEEDQYYLAQNFIAFFEHNYNQVAKLHIESGWVASSTRVDQFAASIRAVCEPILSLPPDEISFGTVLLRLFEVGRAFELVVQPQLMMLQKTLVNLEGLCRTLSPKQNIWKSAEPILVDWSKNQRGFQSIKTVLSDQWPKWLHQYPEIAMMLMRKLKNETLPSPNPPQKKHLGPSLLLVIFSVMLGILSVKLHAL